MRTFAVYRPHITPGTHDKNQMNEPDEIQFEGVEFDDGTVAIRWLTEKGSTSVWASMDDMLAIHGHEEYGTYFVWY